MAEPWGEEKVVQIILDSAKDDLVDLTDIEQLIKIAYAYGVIDGCAIEGSNNQNEIKKLKADLRGKDNEIKDLECRIKYLQKFAPDKNDSWFTKG